MIEYRGYILNSEGKILEAVDFTSTDDATAMRHAKDISGGHSVELWQGKRLVARSKAFSE